MIELKDAPSTVAEVAVKSVRRMQNVQQTGRIVYNPNLAKWYAVSSSGTTLATGSKSRMLELYPQFIVKE